MIFPSTRPTTHAPRPKRAKAAQSTSSKLRRCTTARRLRRRHLDQPRREASYSATSGATVSARPPVNRATGLTPPDRAALPARLMAAWLRTPRRSPHQAGPPNFRSGVLLDLPVSYVAALWNAPMRLRLDLVSEPLIDHTLSNGQRQKVAFDAGRFAVVHRSHRLAQNRALADLGILDHLCAG